MSEQSCGGSETSTTKDHYTNMRKLCSYGPMDWRLTVERCCTFPEKCRGNNRKEKGPDSSVVICAQGGSLFERHRVNRYNERKGYNGDARCIRLVFCDF